MIFPKKPQILYAPMLATFGGGSANGFKSSGSSGLYDIGAMQYVLIAPNKYGRYGPDLTEVRNGVSVGAGSASVITTDTSLLDVTSSYPSGYIHFTIPETRTYRLRAVGAGGGIGSSGTGNSGGKGANVRKDFNLTQGQVLRIVIGQIGANGGNGGNGSGGGGGTFVANHADGSALVVAGGGGGGGHNAAGLDAPATNYANGYSAGSTGGPGLDTQDWGGASGGGYSNASAPDRPSFGGNSNYFHLGGGGFLYDAIGGNGEGGYGGGNLEEGGFGGGGGAADEGGGGGGYSGGGGGWFNPARSSGGGGSYALGGWDAHSNTPNTQNGYFYIEPL